MSELLRKQVDGVMKMEIPEANASPRKGCEENERRKKNDGPPKKIFSSRRTTKGAVEEQWNGSQ